MSLEAHLVPVLTPVKFHLGLVCIHMASFVSHLIHVLGLCAVFLYERGDHDVITLSQADFASCTVSSYTARYETGNDTVTLDKPGPAYFSCSLPGHCPDMKFFINVLPAPTLPPGGNNAGQTPPPPSAATLSRSVTHPLEFALLAAATAAVLGLQLL